MELNSGGAPRRHWVELALLLAVFAVGSGLGMAMLRAHRSADGLSSIGCPTTFFARPLMIAAGRGSFHPEIEAAPGLLAFLERRTATFDPASLPKDIPVSYDSAAEYHLYLGWTVAMIWRMLGISWLVLEPFLALVLGLCAVCVYGLFRLAMNRGLSLAGAALFATSPAVLDQLSNMRDFCKAPFLLGGMFAIGWLITRKLPVRFLWLVVALMGLLAGVGMGFRQDAIILVPASLAAILVLSPGAVYRRPFHRVGAALVYLLAFLATAAPMLIRMEGGAQPYHPLAQGYSIRHMDRNSLAMGSCEPLACSHDNFVFATVFSYARRATGNDHLYFEYNDPGDVQFTRSWVVRTAIQFPADTIARGYGSVLNVLSGADTCMAALSYHEGWYAILAKTHGRIADFFRLAGIPLALLVLLATAAAAPRIAVALVLLTLYFCGYVSLDNEWRHTFHLSFVCFWVAGFLLQQLSCALGHGFRDVSRWGVWLSRSGVFLFLGVLAFYTPWQAARFWQQHALNNLLRQYASLPRSVVPTRAVPMQDWKLFRLKSNSSSAARLTRLGEIPILGDLLQGSSSNYWETTCRLYAVCLRARQTDHAFLAKYWGNPDEGASNDFTQIMRVAGTDREGGETWFFFPVYEFAYRTLFEGVAFADEDAGDFLGLYRVDDKAQPLLLPCVALNEPTEPERLTAGIEAPYDPMQFLTPENEWVQISESGERAEKLGLIDTAAFYTRAANALRPSSEQRSRIASLYEKAGQTEMTLRLLKSTVLSSRGDIVSCIALEEFLKRRAAEMPASPVWEELVQQTSSPFVWQAYERSLEGKDVEKRMSVLRQLLRITPDDLGSAGTLQHLLEDKAARLEEAGDLSGAVGAYREAVPLNPRNNEPVLSLEKILSKRGGADRRSTWDTVWRDNPDNPHVAVLCGRARAAVGDLAGAKEAFDAVRRLAPEESYYCVLAADALATAGAWEDAASAYERALALNPKLDYLHGRLDEARKRAAEASRLPEPAAPAPLAP